MSFFKRNKEKIFLIIVAIGLLTLIGVTSGNRENGMTGIERFVGNILTPVKKVTNSLSYNVSNGLSNIKGVGKLKKENEELKSKVLELEEANRNYENIVGKSEYLKREYKLMETTKYNLKQAQITGKEPGNWFDKFTINLGTKDGIKKGDTVVQGAEIEQNIVVEGLVGRVIEVGDNWAKVATIVDELSSISFKGIRTQDGGIITGSVDNQISGYMYDYKSDIIKGDRLYTSGLGKLFSTDLYIGEVKEVINDDEEMMKRIEVEPAINFQKLFRVFVISE